MAEPLEHTATTCDQSLSRAFGFLGKKWNGVLLATLIAGPASFSDLKRSVTGISDSMLSDRLTELTDVGLVARTVTGGPPVSVSYELTEVGLGLAPVIEELGNWARAYLVDEV